MSDAAAQSHAAAIRRRHAVEAAGLAAFVATVLGLSLIVRPIDAFLVSFVFYAFAYCLFIVRRLGRVALQDLPAQSANFDAKAGVVLGVGVALVGADLVLVAAAMAGGVTTAGGALLVGASVLASWTLLHLVFAVHYAHAFYADIDGAADELVFPGGRPSHFSDFLYFSFVIGMTFQVSDVVVAGPRLRRLVLAHGVLSFFLNVFVLSLTITAVGGMAGAAGAADLTSPARRT